MRHSELFCHNTCAPSGSAQERVSYVNEAIAVTLPSLTSLLSFLKRVPDSSLTPGFSDSGG